MSKLSNHRLFPLLGGILLAWLIIVPVLKYLSTQKSFQLSNSEIQHDSGCAYVLEITHSPFGWPIVYYVGDSPEDAQASRLILLENGKVIGQSHAMHDTIRNIGLGNYSHWGRNLYFSTSECSDPRNNGRHYEATIPVTLTKFAYISWFIAAIIVGSIIGQYLSNSPRFKKLIGPINKALFFPTNFLQQPIPTLIVFFILLISAWGFLISIWESGRSINPLVLGWYQVSDSMAYWLCSNSVLDVRNFGAPGVTGEWCQRRSTYPTFLSGIVWIAQRNIFATLLIQALITCTAIYIVVRRSANFVGAFGALLCTALLFKYSMVDVFALTMTENAGLVFGCIGLALLLVASERRDIIWMTAGIAMISIAMNARAGAFFILPFLVFWAGVTAYLSNKKVWQWICLSTIAISAGFVLQALLVLAVGGSPGSSHGNFSYTLYGLSVGGKGWQQVLSDHPEISGPDAQMSKAIYALAWQNITSQPLLFLHGLQKNFSLFISMGTYGFEKLGALSPLFKAGWWLAWVSFFINRRNPTYLLIGLSSLGIVLSAPLLLSDGGARVFAASIAVDVLQMAIGLSWVRIIITQGIKQALQPLPILCASKDTMSTRLSLEVGFSIFLLLLLIIPHTPLRQLQNPKPMNVNQCVNEYTVVTRIGSGGSMLLDFVADDQQTDFLKGEVKHDVFLGGLNPSLWWYEQMKNFMGKSLLLAYQQDRTDPYAPGPYPVYSDQHLAEFYGHTVQLCIDKQEKQKIFDIPYRKLNSIKILD